MSFPVPAAFVWISLTLGVLACSEAPPGSDGTGGAPATGGGPSGGTNTGGTGGTPAGGSTSGGTAGTGAASGTAGVAGDAGGATPGGSGGASGAGGASGGTGADGGAGLGGLGGTPGRPVLTDEQAVNFTILAYLAKAGPVTAPTTDNWDPTAGVGDVAGFTPTFTVAASGGTHTSVQAAITAAVTAGGTNRSFIRVMPGEYREVVCVPTGAPPITLYSTSADATQTTIVYDHLAGDTVDIVNPCVVPSGTTYGTGGSATFAVYGSNFHAKNLTIQNDGDETMAAGAVQGVALNTRGDKLVFENVHFLANQDTLLVGSTNPDTIQRAYFKGTTIEGDVDFICGRGTAVFDGGTIRLATNRRANGNLLAPSTNSRNAYGFLVIGATFTAATGAQAGGMTLGRAWDESQVDVPTYTANVMTGVYPNGQAVVRDSMLGPHVNGTAPWASAATTSRPYSSTPTATLPANRLYEFSDIGP